ncbi:hypothetical protein T11_13453 [Trichinella zimbabwensis]|uniref:Uncharacterized protein n=1 Tax=Trichinella zimbabwensis TaxID=268475 RepID=A0A0V1HV36_9BILA|nr:hypothetical protein T11_13453 [Trichinella zimbabwensis]
MGKHRPANALDALALCPKDCYPSVSLLLQIFATLPIALANAERSFSPVKYSRPSTFADFKTAKNKSYF